MRKPLFSKPQLTLICAFGVAITAIVAQGISGAQVQQDPWSSRELMDPGTLAKALKSAETPPPVFCVAFPVLYRQRHILHAKLAGPANSPEGLRQLREAVQALPRDEEIVIYCGCCPMQNCPNIRPAYRLLKDLGFNRIRVLNLPTNFHTDWAEKGYPVE